MTSPRRAGRRPERARRATCYTKRRESPIVRAFTDHWEDNMAKGQMRSNKEAKKPKKDKGAAKGAAATAGGAKKK